jgi:hypothetical protein
LIVTEVKLTVDGNETVETAVTQASATHFGAEEPLGWSIQEAWEVGASSHLDKVTMKPFQHLIHRSIKPCMFSTRPQRDQIFPVIDESSLLFLNLLVVPDVSLDTTPFIVIWFVEGY